MTYILHDIQWGLHLGLIFAAFLVCTTTLLLLHATICAAFVVLIGRVWCRRNRSRIERLLATVEKVDMGPNTSDANSNSIMREWNARVAQRRSSSNNNNLPSFHSLADEKCGVWI